MLLVTNPNSFFCSHSLLLINRHCCDSFIRSIPPAPPRPVFPVFRGLRSLRQACVASVLAKLFEGPGAANGISWIRLRHADKLDDIGLIDWLCKIKDTAVSGAYRASVGENHSVGEKVEGVVTPFGTRV